jgi:hypothetical protein
LAPGFAPLAMKISFAVFDAFLINYLWRNWSFNIRSAAFFAGVFGKKLNQKIIIKIFILYLKILFFF